MPTANVIEASPGSIFKPYYADKLTWSAAHFEDQDFRLAKSRTTEVWISKKMIMATLQLVQQRAHWIGGRKAILMMLHVHSARQTKTIWNAAISSMLLLITIYNYQPHYYLFTSNQAERVVVSVVVYAMRCYTYLRNVSDITSHGTTPYQKRFSAPFTGKRVPFGAATATFRK